MRRPVRILAALFVAVILIHLICRPRFEGDTRALIHDAARALSCLQKGSVGACPEAGNFPLFQMAPAMLLQWLGATEEGVLRVFAYVSLACFGGSLWLLRHTLARRDGLIARFAVLVYLSGFVLTYAHSTFSEMAASALTLAMVAACLLGLSPWLCGALLLVSALSKETAAPLLLILAATATWIRSRRARDWHALLGRGLALLLGCGLALALNAGFNYFKFAGPLNRVYLQPEFQVHEFRHQLSFFGGLWFSPNGGLLFFWPAWVAIFPAILWQLTRKSPTPHQPWTFASAILLLTLLTTGFSKWYGPFGWVCWGPRLLLPWLPAIMLLLLDDYAAQMRATLTRLAAHPMLARSCVALAALVTFANFRVVLYRSFVDSMLELPGCSGVPIQSGANRYYQCLELLTWPWPHAWPMLRVYGLFPRPDLFVLSLVYCAGWVALAGRLLETTKAEGPLEEGVHEEPASLNGPA